MQDTNATPLLEVFNLLVDAVGALLIPIVLFLLGQWFLKAKERADSARRDADQLAAFVDHLSSDSKERRKLALLALTHMQNADLFPDALLQLVESIAARDDPEVSAAARLALGQTHLNKDLSSDDRSLLLELLLPMKVHFERSLQAFKQWVETPPSKPNLTIEDAIKKSNSVIRNLLTTKWHLIPSDLQADALQLVEHYDAWLAEYERLRPGGVRNPDVAYVFVGPKGYPFPSDAADRFLDRYATLAGDQAHGDKRV